MIQSNSQTVEQQKSRTLAHQNIRTVEQWKSRKQKSKKVEEKIEEKQKSKKVLLLATLATFGYHVFTKNHLFTKNYLFTKTIFSPKTMFSPPKKVNRFKGIALYQVLPSSCSCSCSWFQYLSFNTMPSNLVAQLKVDSISNSMGWYVEIGVKQLMFVKNTTTKSFL